MDCVHEPDRIMATREVRWFLLLDLFAIADGFFKKLRNFTDGSVNSRWHCHRRSGKCTTDCHLGESNESEMVWVKKTMAGQPSTEHPDTAACCSLATRDAVMSVPSPVRCPVPRGAVAGLRENPGWRVPAARSVQYGSSWERQRNRCTNRLRPRCPCGRQPQPDDR